MSKRPVALVILDGFGDQKQVQYNAIAQARTPHLAHLYDRYPHTVIHAAGQFVGLLPGMVGNSEVGHLTIGAGRVVKQPITLIHEAIADGSFFMNQTLTDTLQPLALSPKKVHLIGLLSDGGVHSHLTHLFAYIKAAHNAQVKHIVIHPILDGRDSPPQSATIYLTQLVNYIKNIPEASIGSMHGRYYAMDRDHNWERTKQVYDVLARRSRLNCVHWQDALASFYKQGITDEFILPTPLTQNGYIEEGDAIIFCNERPERMTQLARSLTEKNFSHFHRTNRAALSFCMSPTDYAIAGCIPLFPRSLLSNTLKEVLSQHYKTIFSIAETEKFAHITFFFSGDHHNLFPGETPKLIPSLKVKTYAEYPCMSAPEITAAIVDSLQKEPADFYLINYANADMVAHSGNLAATIQAIECLDKQISILYKHIVCKYNGVMIITGDHGNAEYMFDTKTKQSHTAHTANPVPFIYCSEEKISSHLFNSVKELADIAPFILTNMHIDVPGEMKK